MSDEVCGNCGTYNMQYTLTRSTLFYIYIKNCEYNQNERATKHETYSYTKKKNLLHNKQDYY